MNSTRNIKTENGFDATGIGTIWTAEHAKEQVRTHRYEYGYSAKADEPTEVIAAYGLMLNGTMKYVADSREAAEAFKLEIESKPSPFTGKVNERGHKVEIVGL